VESSSEALPSHEYLAFAATARLVATSLTYPHEVLRTRVREEHVGGRQYSSMLGSVRSVLRSDGVAGLYRGIGVHMMRVVPNAAILFTVYEAVLRATRHISVQ
jgi:solute carrier family 25 protein 33/36